MQVWALWHGGASYAVGTVDRDCEEFDSLRAAKRVLEARADFDPHYPCVDESSMLIWFSDPRGVQDPYPDRELTIGPRGGVRSTIC